MVQHLSFLLDSAKKHVDVECPDAKHQTETGHYSIANANFYECKHTGQEIIIAP